MTLLTPTQGVYANGRRTRRVPQLQCIGGSAAGKFEPDQVACTKAFTDGRDVYWKCEADMPDLYKCVTDFYTHSLPDSVPSGSARRT